MSLHTWSNHNRWIGVEMSLTKILKLPVGVDQPGLPEAIGETSVIHERSSLIRQIDDHSGLRS
jgi:hypothetical protein